MAQPISMMTVKSNVGNSRKEEENLLTLRILENSERKMRLIKELISPEKYDSLINNKKAIDRYRDSVDETYDISPNKLESNSVSEFKDGGPSDGASRSVPVYLTLKSKSKPNKLDRNFSRSIAKLHYDKQFEIQTKRSEAISFFHSQSEHSTMVIENNDIIEPRAGFWPDRSNTKYKELILDELSQSSIKGIWMKLVNQVRQMFGHRMDPNLDNDTQFQEFLTHYVAMDIFATPNNLRSIWNRFVASNHHTKVPILGKQTIRSRYIAITVKKGTYSSDKYYKVQASLAIGKLVLPTRVRYLIESNVSDIPMIGIFKNKLEKLIGGIFYHDIDTESKKPNFSIEFKPIEIRIRQHPKLAIEEQVATRIRVLMKRRQIFYSKYEREFVSLDSDLTSIDINSVQNYLNLKIDIILHSIKEIKNLDQILQSDYQILVDQRKQQNKNITGLDIISLGARDDLFEKISDNLTKIANKFNLMKKFDDRDRIISIIEKLRSLPDKLDLDITHDKSDTEEEKRRIELDTLVRSMTLRIQINDKFVNDYQAKDRITTGTFNLIPGKTYLSVFDGLNQANLHVELCEPKLTLFTWPKQVVCSSSISFDLVNNDNHEQTIVIDMNFNSQDGSRIEMEVECNLLTKSLEQPPVANKASMSSSGYYELIDYLYEQVFIPDSTTSNDLKLSRLLNHVEPRCILELLIKKYKISVKIQPQKAILRLNTDVMQVSGDTNLDIRQRLLVWRWLNRINQPIHFSRAENLKRHGLGLRSKDMHLDIDNILLQIPLNDHRRIEQRRLRAIKMINHYEQGLREWLELNSRKIDPPGRHMHELLREPELGRTIDLVLLLKSFKSLIPKHKARRPLMPNRRINKRRHTLSSSRPIDLESSIGPSPDITETLNHSSRNYHPNMQLVVTVQHATDVPMRLVNQDRNSSFMNQGSRSTSPMMTQILGTSSPSFAQSNLGRFSPNTDLVSLVNLPKLVPPMIYVEVVFQRHQQATSLTSGRDPIWNETLFFPVESSQISDHNKDHLNEATTSRINEEFLQLNLYDYVCYVDQSMDDGSVSYLGNLPTANMSSLAMNANTSDWIDEHNLSLSSARRISASRQRVERHLIGNLRIPLSILLSNDKIEGSFRLNQPLFMDNYQFMNPVLERHASMSAGTGLQLAPGRGRANVNSRSINSMPETHISLFISLDPPLEMPNPVHLSLDSYEQKNIYDYARYWELILSNQRYEMTKGNNVTRHALAIDGAGPSNSSNTMIANWTSQQSNINGPTNNGWRKNIRGLKIRRYRHVRTLAISKDAKYYLINRLIYPLKAPHNLISDDDDMNKMIAKLARFISLLRPVKEGFFKIRFLDSRVLFDPVQLLEHNIGGRAEKAILFCNYLLHLGLCCSLLFGEAIPEGSCVYCIVWHEELRSDVFQLIDKTTSSDPLPLNPNDLTNQDQITSRKNVTTKPPVNYQNFLLRLPRKINGRCVEIWDPQSGRSYSLQDQLPLISIGSIVSPHNVYANIQANDCPSETDFDIRHKEMWFPLFSESDKSSTKVFGNNVSIGQRLSKRLRQNINLHRHLADIETWSQNIGYPMIGPIIENQSLINYQTFTDEQCDQLRLNVEKAIKSNLIKWRRDRPTFFNRTMSRNISEKLSLMEDRVISSFDNSHQDSPRTSPELVNFKNDWRNDFTELIKSEILTLISGPNSRKVISWPVNISFIGIKPILDSLYASDVHSADLLIDPHGLKNNKTVSPSQMTQFIVSSHAKAYPAHVISMWIYVAALVPNVTNNHKLMVS